MRELWTESSEKEVHGWTFVMGLGLGVIVTCVTAHWRISAAEQTQWSQGLDGLYCDSCQLFPKILYKLFINKVAMLTCIDVIHELSYIDFFLTKADLAAIAEGPTCQHINSKNQSWAPNMATFPRRTSQPPGGKLITLDSFHHWGGSEFFSLE